MYYVSLYLIIYSSKYIEISIIKYLESTRVLTTFDYPQRTSKAAQILVTNRLCQTTPLLFMLPWQSVKRLPAVQLGWAVRKFQGGWGGSVVGKSKGKSWQDTDIAQLICCCYIRIS